MELKHLRYLIAAVEEGSLQAAAARVNIAQPALSRRIRDLEAAVGCMLLTRSSRGIIPTKAGLALYRDALLMVEELNDSVQRARQLGNQQGRSIHMGLPPTVAQKFPILRDALERFCLGHPARPLAIRRRLSGELTEALREGAIDLAFMYEQRPDSPHVSERLVHREAYVLALHPLHRLAELRTVELSDLAGCPLIWLERRDSVGKINPMEAQLRRHGLEPMIDQHAETRDEQIDIAVACVGACITPASTMLSVPSGMLVFRPLPRLGVFMDFTMAWRKEGGGALAARLLGDLHLAIDRHQLAIQQALGPFALLGDHSVFRID